MSFLILHGIMRQQPPIDDLSLFAPDHSRCWLRWLVTLLVVCYAIQLLQAVSPLRIDGDGIDYLTAAAAAADGAELVALSRATMRPIGYPIMIAALDRMGIAKPSSLVLLNCGWLLVSLAASYAIARIAYKLDKRVALLTCLLTLLSFLIVKHTPLVASEIPYLGLSLASLAAFECFDFTDTKVPQKIALLLTGIFLLLAATLTRSIGVTLLPALGWSVLRVSLPRRRLLDNKCLVFSGTAIVAVAVAVWWARFAHSFYGRLFVEAYRSGLGRTLTGIVFMRLKQLGEVALNVPSSQVPAVRFISWVVGLIVALLLFLGLARRRRSLTATDIYLLSSLGSLLVTPWSGGGGRYLIPVLPIVIAAILADLRVLWEKLGWARMGVYVMGLLYVLTGVVAMGYSTGITFSGARFPERYGSDGRLAPTYRLFLRHQTPAPGEELNPDALRVLQRYGGH